MILSCGYVRYACMRDKCQSFTNEKSNMIYYSAIPKIHIHEA